MDKKPWEMSTEEIVERMADLDEAIKDLAGQFETENDPDELGYIMNGQAMLIKEYNKLYDLLETGVWEED